MIYVNFNTDITIIKLTKADKMAQYLSMEKALNIENLENSMEKLGLSQTGPS